MTAHPYHAIVAHYERCLSAHGDGARAVDWKSAGDAALRYDVMLDLVRQPAEGKTLLDFGCGLGALKDHMKSAGLEGVTYVGLEISAKFATAARARNPDVDILCMDVLSEGAVLPEHDYIVMNGIFTRRHDVSVQDMESYMHKLLYVVYASCREGLAFNVMSKAVDWEDDMLFHPDPGALLAFIANKLTRHFILRNDYGLHETTCYLYRKPIDRRAPPARAAP